MALCRLFGVSTLDIVRASTFVTEVLQIPQESSKYAIPVVGGHSGATIVPLLSQSEPKVDEKLLGDKEKVDKLINRIQFGGDEVVKAKDGAGSATVSFSQRLFSVDLLMIRPFDSSPWPTPGTGKIALQRSITNHPTDIVSA